MNSIYERLKSLFEITGLDVTRGTYAEAEAYALSVGVQHVKSRLDAVKSEVFFLMYPETDSLDCWARMLSLNSEKIELQELRELLAIRLAENFGDAQLNSVLELQSLALGGFMLTPSGDTITVSGVDSTNIFHLGRYLCGTTYFGMKAVLEGNGLTFRQWDSLNKSFNFLDSLRLPFSCIDTLSYDLF
ncbi:MAG: hypothetical protein II744_05090 [Eubacterium sp.]|nr:hypothetical protein [Eubacterium sp.]